MPDEKGGLNMRQVVVDASVVIKWIFPERRNEKDIPASQKLLQKIREGEIELCQPPHWLAEVAAVCVRLSPGTSQQVVDLLYAMEFPVIDSPEIFKIACDLSRSLQHHLFDTLYHAVALSLKDCPLITADGHYFRKARKFGSITALSDFVG